MTAGGWGPQHMQGLPGGLKWGGAAGGRWWWAIAAGTVLAVPGQLRAWSDGSFGTWLMVAAVLAGSAFAVGAGERRAGKPMAAGRQGAFAVAAVASLFAAGGVPAVAYLAAFYGSAAVWAQRGGAVATRLTSSLPARSAEPAGPAALPAYSGGFMGRNGKGQPVVASARGAALVIGPPGSGKTQAVIMPSVAYAPAAVVSTSIKAEVLTATAAARAQRGRVWWFDPGGTSTPPAGVVALRWNPLVDVDGWDSARSVAGRLAAAKRSGADADSHWLDRAEGWLAVLLLAARITGPAGGRGDLAALARWSLAPAAPKAAQEVERAVLAAVEAGMDGAELADALLSGLLDLPDKEQQSIASTVTRIMSVYASAAAVRAGEAPNFDPNSFVRSADSVFITAPVDRQRDFGPLIAGFLESVRLAQYRRREAADLGHEPAQEWPVTFVLDEAANTAPIPIPAIASEAGGQGLHLVVAFQSLAQARDRWGKAADDFLTLFPDKLILSGMADEATARQLSAMSGEYDRMTRSVSQQESAKRGPLGGTRYRPPSVSYSTQRTAVLSVADITGVPAGQGLFWTPRGWALLAQDPWWSQRQRYSV